ncbi:MAG: M20/M25/M40 family metallo-hydrolase, partial [Chlamydiia bacterium]|nr:M20/M25/M40 family metallo-hydrolase [Chlamydiia bacterium]
MEIDGEETFQESFQSSTLLEKCRKYFEANEERLYNEYLAFLRFPSISTDPEHFDDILACAHWVRQRLIQLGFQVETWQTDTESPPVLFGRCLEAGPELPTLLFYSHYDVQPTDPDSQWQSPPFEPRKADQEIYARGAQDNKGQCFYLL